MMGEWFDTTADIRDRVASVFEHDPESWGQGFFAAYEDPEGGMRPCDLSDGRATCWCVTGLILKFEDDDQDIYLPMAENDHEWTRQDWRVAIETFNDEVATTAQDVIDALRNRKAPFDWA